MSDMTPEDRERYIRWTDHRINHLSYSINLFLGFAVASVAYCVNLKIDGKLLGSCSLDASLILFGISALFGSLATVTKLLDYRYTARRIKDGGVFNELMASHIGSFTWAFFWLQLAVYAAGAFVFIRGAVYT
jgi:hypothetical protein